MHRWPKLREPFGDTICLTNTSEIVLAAGLEYCFPCILLVILNRQWVIVHKRNYQSYWLTCELQIAVMRQVNLCFCLFQQCCVTRPYHYQKAYTCKYFGVRPLLGAQRDNRWSCDLWTREIKYESDFICLQSYSYFRTVICHVAQVTHYPAYYYQ